MLESPAIPAQTVPQASLLQFRLWSPGDGTVLAPSCPGPDPGGALTVSE